MVAITICSDFGAQKIKVWHRFHSLSIYFPWSDETRCHDLSFLNAEVQTWESAMSRLISETTRCAPFYNRASLVVQWQTVHLAMQGTSVWSLIWEDPMGCRTTEPGHHDYWACALEPGNCNCWAHVLQLLKSSSPRARGSTIEATAMRSSCTAVRATFTLVAAAREKPTEQQRPSTAKNK